ncbi:heat shock 70 kDa 17 [Olea europaea subsp. europaea]|uniref:Heat shock 70 kDa 17 n=1 Tax=Olea europaea subsp. europaea TaxID=158383 RepID=A0A8S0UE47_OLEEU|nr:heat shock 70 kDa 17 [Olea europaea subsp. europaea]
MKLGTCVYRTEGEGEYHNFTAKKLVAMILKYAMGLAENHARISVKDLVITVPPYVGVAERRGLLTVADLAGINVLACFTFCKLFQVKDVRWDAELEGQNMELRLVEYFVDEFNKQLGNGVDIRNNVKAMAKLKKQVKRT